MQSLPGGARVATLAPVRDMVCAETAAASAACCGGAGSTDIPAVGACRPLEVEIVRKTSFIAVLLLALPAVVHAQRTQTLISGDIESGGFGGPVLKATRVAGTDALFMGGRGGWIINHTFVLGGGGYGLVTSVEKDVLGDGTLRRLDMGYGGVELEYVVNSYRLVHWSASLLLGAGGISYRDLSGNVVPENGEAFLIAEPGAYAVLNVTDFFRFAAGASYRFTTGELGTITSEDLDGGSVVLMAKFGSF